MSTRRAILSFAVLLGACRAPTAGATPEPALGSAPEHRQRETVPGVSDGVREVVPTARTAAGRSGASPRPESVRAAVAAAQELVRAGELGRGLTALEQLHRSCPEVAGPVLATVLHQQALRHYAIGELVRAQQIWVRVASVDPAHPTARSAWAEVQREREALGRMSRRLSGRERLPGAGPGG